MDSPGLIFVLGFLSGGGLVLLFAYWFRFIQTKSAEQLAQELFQQSETTRQSHEESTLRMIENTFARLSREALSESKEDFLQLANTRLGSQVNANSSELDTKKQLIDRQLEQMNMQLEHVSSMVQSLEKDRAEKFGELSRNLEIVGENIHRLNQTTTTLQTALADNRTRGQWGERIAEDILRALGFVEKINYLRQAQTGSQSRPDFTFLLPQQRKLNMDVKFPYNNYMQFLYAESDVEQDVYRKRFLRDVRARVREIAERDYINPSQDTLDYALMFVPNEQIYRFIHENDHSIIQSALSQRVVMCSPVTLFAVLAVVRQAVDNFMLEQSTRDVLQLLEEFHQHWGGFVEKMERVGRQLDVLGRSYDDLLGTRKQQLEKPLARIDELKSQFGDEQETEELLSLEDAEV